MPGAIQRYPQGLIPLLGMQTSGDTPKDLAPLLQATIEIGDYYARDRIEHSVTNAGTITGISIFSASSIPAGETWLVYDISVHINPLAAATEIRPRLGIMWASALPIFFQGFGPAPQTLVAGESTSLGWHFERPIIMRNGDSVGVWNEHWLAGGTPMTMFTGIRFCRLRI